MKVLNIIALAAIFAFIAAIVMGLVVILFGLEWLRPAALWTLLGSALAFVIVHALEGRLKRRGGEACQEGRALRGHAHDIW